MNKAKLLAAVLAALASCLLAGTLSAKEYTYERMDDAIAYSSNNVSSGSGNGNQQLGYLRIGNFDMTAYNLNRMEKGLTWFLFDPADIPDNEQIVSIKLQFSISGISNTLNVAPPPALALYQASANVNINPAAGTWTGYYGNASFTDTGLTAGAAMADHALDVTSFVSQAIANPLGSSAGANQGKALIWFRFELVDHVNALGFAPDTAMGAADNKGFYYTIPDTSLLLVIETTTIPEPATTSVVTGTLVVLLAFLFHRRRK